MPQISVIVPVYNAEKYLHRCIDSILAQTFSDFELLLIDDGSKDNSGRICDEYAAKDSRIRVFHKKNGGVSSARNMGLDNAKGDWITFVDSDDWIETEFLNECLQGNDVDYIIVSYAKHMTNDQRIEEYFEPYKTYTIDSCLFVDNNFKLMFFTPWAKFFKTSIIKKNKLCFEDGIHISEDTLFVFQYLLYINSVSLSSKISYNWIDSNGLSQRTYSIFVVDKIVNMLQRAITQIENRFHVNLLQIKLNNIVYLFDKIDITQTSFRDIYSYLRNSYSRNQWLLKLVEDNEYIKKGKRRLFFDLLYSRKLFLMLAILCNVSKRFY